MATFTENNNGVHLMSVLNPEHTLCGDAFDIGFCENESCGDLTPTSKKTVTCPRCVKEIENCRGIRINKNALK